MHIKESFENINTNFSISDFVRHSQRPYYNFNSLCLRTHGILSTHVIHFQQSPDKTGALSALQVTFHI